jgi:NADH-quinone oxidoreductase subunit L
MIGRNAVLFAHAPDTLMIVALVGVATAFLAGTIGLVQNDIKRVLAYSTVSQLGYMFLAMGVGAYAAGIFHLLTHAFFKALLFLGAGAVIHALAGEQDLRRMGGLRRELPITYWTFVIGALAIAGVPGLAGFFSKDEILFRTFAGGHALLWGVGLVTSLLTAVYMFRLVFLAFHGAPAAGAERPADGAHAIGASGAPADGPAAAHAAAAPAGAHGAGPGGHRHLHDAPPAMAVALVLLAAGSVLAGYLGVPPALGGSNAIEQFLAPSFVAAPEAAHVEAAHGASEGVELALMALSSLVALAGIAGAAWLFLWNRRAADGIAERFPGVVRLLRSKYYVDEIYDTALVQPIRIVSEEGLWKRVDVRVIDGAVNGVGGSVGVLADVLRRAQTGSVRAYAASLFLGVVLIVGFYLWR